MKKVEISATVPANEKEGKPEASATILVDYPDFEADAEEALEELVEHVGEKAVGTNAFANWRITLQSNMRSGLKKGETQEAMQARLGSAKMGISQAGIAVDPEQAFFAKFASASAEEKAAMLARLQERAAS
jgi:hypothetical protein